jgi:hypothetical protein
MPGDAGIHSRTCTAFSGLNEDADCLYDNDLVPPDGAMAMLLDIPSETPSGSGSVTITQEGLSTTEDFVVTGPAASVVVVNATGRSELISGSTECDYPTTLEGLQTLPQSVLADPRRNALIVKLLDASGNEVVGRVWWYWPFESSGAALFAGASTVTMDLGSNGIGAVQLVCGMIPGEQTSTAWGRPPFYPPLLYQNVTVKVVDAPATPTATPTPTETPMPTSTNTPTPSPTEPPCPEDVNRDGAVTVKDLVIVARGLARQDMRSDVNGDGRVTAKDLRRVIRALLRDNC